MPPPLHLNSTSLIIPKTPIDFCQADCSLSPSSVAINPAAGLPAALDIWHDFRRESIARCIPARTRCLLWRAEVLSLHVCQALLGEFFGMSIFLALPVVTTSIVFTHPGAAKVDSNDLSSIPRTVLISEVFGGLTISVLIFALSTFSSGQLNPAVSFALLLHGAISLPASWATS